MSDFVSPLGRLVQGDCFEGQTTDDKGQPLTVKTGPNKGQPATKFFIAIAIPKTDAGLGALYAQLVAEARAGYPQHYDAAGNCTHPRMTYKLMDGDGVDANGKSNANKEGFAGHWILKCSSSYAPKCFFMGKYAAHEQIQDKRAIKRGDWVRVMGTITANTGSDVPGVYVNHNIVELCYVGDAITSGPDASALGAVPLPSMPAGAQALPAGLVGAAAMALPGSAGALPVAAMALPGAAVAAPPAMALPGAAVAAPPAMALPGAAVAAPMALPGAPPLVQNTAFVQSAMVPVYIMAAAAVQAGHTRESLNAQGYTDDVLLANGWMTKQ